jgi:hypothetical protein
MLFVSDREQVMEVDAGKHCLLSYRALLLVETTANVSRR